MPRMARERSRTSASLALPDFERCDRPTHASDSRAKVQPGRLAQGPDEKWEMCGRAAGLAVVVMVRYSFQNSRSPLGGSGPAPLLETRAPRRKRKIFALRKNAEDRPRRSSRSARA